MTNNNSLKVCGIGRTKTLLNSISFLHKNEFDVKLIITSKQSDHDPVTPKDFKKLASKIGANLIETNNINDLELKNQIKKYSFDIGVSVNNPRVISKEILSLFKHGILNAHPGDLPKYRGNATPNWAIIKNKKKIPITIHFMDEGLDSGPILIKKFFKINQATTVSDFYQFAEKEVPTLFLSALKKIKKGNVKTITQSKNPKKILRAYPRNKFDGKINWNMSATLINRIIRASGPPFFGAYTFYNNKKMFILDSRVEKPKFKFYAEPGQVAERRKNGDVVVASSKDFLVITKVRYNDVIFEKPTKLIKSIYTRLGMNLEEEIERILNKLELN